LIGFLAFVSTGFGDIFRDGIGHQPVVWYCTLGL
jgi:hypothetical protein